jgi:nodulation protein E
MSATRVVITGLGGICGLGVDSDAIWTAMREGRSAIAPLRNEWRGELKVTVGAAIPVLPDHGIDRKQLVTMDRFSLLAVIAAREALRKSGLDAGTIDPERTGAIIGTGIYGAETSDDGYWQVFHEQKNRINIFTVPRIMPGAPAGQISMTFGLKGPAFGVTSACASSNHALSVAADQLRLGRADVMLAGGTDAPLVFGVLKGW